VYLTIQDTQDENGRLFSKVRSMEISLIKMAAPTVFRRLFSLWVSWDKLLWGEGKGFSTITSTTMTLCAHRGLPVLAFGGALPELRGPSKL